MHSKLLAGAACALLLTSPALAIAPNSASASHAHVAPPTASVKHKTALHHSARRMAIVMQSAHGDREVNALNALEAAGYRGFADLHSKGSDFIATAHKNGKMFDVTVRPGGKIAATNA